MPACGLVPWVWVYCTDYLCGHSRAIALTPWAIRWGVADPGDLICKNFRCVMCDRKGALLCRAGEQHDVRTYDEFPMHRQINIGGARLIPEYWTAHRDRCAAIYESKRELWERFWPL
jgi:hypothetical protein